MNPPYSDDINATNYTGKKIYHPHNKISGHPPFFCRINAQMLLKLDNNSNNNKWIKTYEIRIRHTVVRWMVNWNNCFFSLHFYTSSILMIMNMKMKFIKPCHQKKIFAKNLWWRIAFIIYVHNVNQKKNTSELCMFRENDVFEA